jgi:chromosome segregation ATPase
LKIHYLEEMLEKASPGFSQAALKENTELKVTRVTMQRDLARCKKSLQHAERDLEAYRLQLQELREKARRRQADAGIQRELEWLRQEVTTREKQVNELQGELESAKENESEELEKLRDEIEDLEATVREKDRIIDDKEEEVEAMKENDGKESNAVEELETELEQVKEQLEGLQEGLEQAKLEVQEAKELREEAIEEKERAAEDLRELQDEMSNKSFYTKGLSRQLEEKANKLEDEVNKLRIEHTTLEDKLQDKTRREKKLEEELEGLGQELSSDKDRFQDDLDLAHHERDIAQRERDDVSSRLKKTLEEMRHKGEERDLLQTRHHALTDESSSLQRELVAAQAGLRELEQALEDEKQQALDNNHALRTEHRDEVELLNQEIESLQHEIEDKEGQFAVDEDKWESAQRNLESQKQRAEEQAAGFKRTIEKLQAVEMTLSGRELKLQEVIDSEKERHLQEEAVLSRQIEDLNKDISSKRQTADDQRVEFINIKDELRVSRREENALKEKVQATLNSTVCVPHLQRLRQSAMSCRARSIRRRTKSMTPTD